MVGKVESDPMECLISESRPLEEGEEEGEEEKVREEAGEEEEEKVQEEAGEEEGEEEEERSEEAVAPADPEYLAELRAVRDRGARAQADRVAAVARAREAEAAAAREESLLELENDAFRLSALEFLRLLRGPFFVRRGDPSAPADFLIGSRPCGRAGEFSAAWVDGNLVMQSQANASYQISVAGGHVSGEPLPDAKSQAAAARRAARRAGPKYAIATPKAVGPAQESPIEEVRLDRKGPVRLPISAVTGRRVDSGPQEQARGQTHGPARRRRRPPPPR
jgi:hypothetical protein